MTDLNRVTCTMNEMQEIISHSYLQAYDSGRAADPIMAWGPPGIGKTFSVYAAVKRIEEALKEKEAIASDEKIQCKSIMLSCIEPTDIVGVPSPHPEHPFTRYLPLEWAWLASEEYERAMQKVKGSDWKAPPMCLFFDDFPVAHEQTQAAGYKFFHERMAGDLTVRWNVLLAAAGNRPEDNAAAQGMPTAMASRFRHLNCALMVDEWLRWARVSNIYPMVAAYIWAHTSSLHIFDPNSTEKAFPCPRTWEMVSRICYEFGVNHKLFYKLVCGTVGQGTAMEFTSFIENARSAVPPAEVIANPKTAKIPKGEEMDALHATISNLIVHLNNHPEHWKEATIYTLREDMIEEFGLCLFNHVNDIVLNAPDYDLDDPVYAEALDRYIDLFTAAEG